jgi:hypothetical protein
MTHILWFKQIKEKKPGMVVPAFNSSYSAGGDRRIMVQGWLGQMFRPYLKNKLKAKRLGSLA